MDETLDGKIVEAEAASETVPETAEAAAAAETADAALEAAEAAAEAQVEAEVPAAVSVVNVRFRGRGKSYFFDPNGTDPQVGESVVVETSKGLELGECVECAHTVAGSRVVLPLRPVVRIATKEDLHIGEMNRAREQTAFTICEDKIRAHGLDMKLVDVEYSFEGGKILFFFTSDGRVDFRELVKDLAGVFHTRIELRQIGVRDGAKMLGGLGICGRPFCCSTFLEEFQPVSIRMAKTQNLSLNPTKISGTCGRLMCCLKYEQDAYEHLIKTLPRVDAQVDTPKGKGSVTEVNLLRRTVKVRLSETGDNSVQSYSVDQLGYTLNGEYIEPIPAEEVVSEPAMPDLSLYMADKPGTQEPAERRPRSDHHRGRNPKNRGPRPEGAPADAAEPRQQPSAKSADKAEKQERQDKPARSEDKPHRYEGHGRSGKPHGNAHPDNRGGQNPQNRGENRSEQNQPNRGPKPDGVQNRPPREGKPPRDQQNRGPRPEGAQKPQNCDDAAQRFEKKPREDNAQRFEKKPREDNAQRFEKKPREDNAQRFEKKPREDNAQRFEKVPSEDGAAKSEKKSGNFRHRPYHHDRKKPGGDGGSGNHT